MLNNNDTLKHFVDTETFVFRVTNINFTAYPETKTLKAKLCSKLGFKQNASKPIRLQRIPLDESIMHEEVPDATADVCYQAHARATLFYNTSISYDFVEVIPFRKVEYDAIISKHQNETVEQPFFADDESRDVNSDSDDIYTLSWPKEWYCVVPNSNLNVLQGVLNRKAYHDVVDQLIYEYLLTTLPISVGGESNE